MEEIFEKFSDAETCPVRNIICRFSTKWGLLVLSILSQSGTVRFNQFQKAMPDISPKVLTSTLKTLEADGLITRKIYPTVPPKVEYSLTPIGEELVVHLTPIVKWAKEHFAEISKHRRKYTK